MPTEVQLSGFGATTAAGSFNAGNTPPGGEFIDLTQTLPTSKITKVAFWLYGETGSASDTVAFKVWRYSSTTGLYTCVATTGDLSVSGFAAGRNEITLGTEISSQEGDYIGFQLSAQDSDSSPRLGVTNSGGNVRYKVGASAVDDTTDFTGWSTLTYLLHIEFTGYLANKSGDSTPFDILAIGDALAEGKPAFSGIGSSTVISGNLNSQIWPHLVSSLGTGLDYINAGKDNDTLFDIYDRLQALLDDYAPTYVYLQAGISEVLVNSSVDEYEANLTLILNKVTEAGATLICGQIVPRQYAGVTDEAQRIMTFNARLETWCYENLISLAPTFQGMVDLDVADDLTLSDDYTDDSEFPNVAGYTRLGLLYTYASRPNYTRSWGASAQDSFHAESFDSFKNSGGVTVLGSPLSGTLNIPTGDTADSPVSCIEHDGEPIEITARIVSGTANVYYRTSSTVFKKDDATIGWSVYSGPLTATGQFIQIRVEGDSVADVSLADIAIDWTRVYASDTGPEVPEVEPAVIVAGTTVNFIKDAPDFKPENGWTLTYYLANSSGLFILYSSDNGDSKHLVSATATETALFTAGYYEYKSYATRVDDRHLVSSGLIKIEADYATKTSGYETRTHVKITLDALEAVIQGRATKEDSEYSINGRSLKRLTLEELILAREKYRAYYKQELEADRISKGLGSSRKIRTRFV